MVFPGERDAVREQKRRKKMRRQARNTINGKALEVTAPYFIQCTTSRDRDVGHETYFG